MCVCMHVCVCVCVCVYACVCVCVCVGRIWCTGYLHNNQVCTFMHMYVLCENSDSVRNKNPKSLQVVLCVCAHVCMCVHSCTCTLCKNSASGTAQSLCVCVCACVRVHVGTFMHMYAL